jgi:putative membrane protein
VGEGNKEGATEGRGVKEMGNRFSLGTIFLGALLFMLIDVVIDPLSLRGDRWFLGKIYYYPDGGAYFGVTISNFIGWFIVGFVTLSIWGLIDKRMGDIPPTLPSGLPSPAGGEGNREEFTEPPPSPEEGRHIGTAPTKWYMPSVDLLGPALYMIVLIFNLTMTFYIGEITIGWVGVFIFLPVVFLLGQKIRGDAHTR